MRRLLAATAAGLLLLGAAGCSGSSPGPGTTTGSGSRLPGVTLSALRTGDDPIDLGALKGPAVVNLWANWCAPCRKEMPLLERFHEADPGVRVIGVDTLDTQPALARQVADRAGVTYPLVVDADQAITSAARGLPQTLLVDARGRIVYVAPGAFESVAELRTTVRRHLPSAGVGR